MDDLTFLDPPTDLAPADATTRAAVRTRGLRRRRIRRLELASPLALAAVGALVAVVVTSGPSGGTATVTPATPTPSTVTTPTPRSTATPTGPPSVVTSATPPTPAVARYTPSAAERAQLIATYAAAVGLPASQLRFAAGPTAVHVAATDADWVSGDLRPTADAGQQVYVDTTQDGGGDVIWYRFGAGRWIAEVRGIPAPCAGYAPTDVLAAWGEPTSGFTCGSGAPLAAAGSSAAAAALPVVAPSGALVRATLTGAHAVTWTVVGGEQPFVVDPTAYGWTRTTIGVSGPTGQGSCTLTTPGASGHTVSAGETYSYTTECPFGAPADAAGYPAVTLRVGTETLGSWQEER